MKAVTRMRSGISVDVLNLQDAEIRLTDIASHLSKQCRWLGACSFHYSVAQHSIYVAAQMYGQTRDFGRARKALLHDASEAYLADVIRPLKYTPMFETYLAVERQVQRQIEKFFHVPVGDDELLSKIDNEILILEGQQLFHPPYYPPELVDISPTWEMSIGRWDPEQAEQAFIMCFHDVQKLITVGASQFNVRTASRS